MKSYKTRLHEARQERVRAICEDCGTPNVFATIAGHADVFAIWVEVSDGMIRYAVTNEDGEAVSLMLFNDEPKTRDLDMYLRDAIAEWCSGDEGQEEFWDTYDGIMFHDAEHVEIIGIDNAARALEAM